MKQILTLIILIILWESSDAQKRQLKFFADEEGTQPITELKPGETTFYAIAEMNKKDFKAPFGKLFLYSKYNFIDIWIQVKGLPNGTSTKEETIYDEMQKLPKTFEQYASEDGKLVVPIKLDDYVNFENSMSDVAAFGSKVYPLTVRLGESKEPVGTGVIQWDLTDGGKAYANAALASRSDYTFQFDNAFNEPEFKALVKANIEQRFPVKIYHMVHSERVPYEADFKFYRRNSFAVTLKDLKEEKCYTGSISAFETGQRPSGPPISI